MMSYHQLGPYVLIIFFCISLTYGISDLSLEGRIIKGYKVDIYRYPHAVFLHFKNKFPTACGGSLVSVHTIITAAYCFDELKSHRGKITAFFGSTIPTDSETIRYISNYRIHPKFDPHKGKFNLGLAFFRKSVPLGKDIKKIPIASKPPDPDDFLFTCGWGKQEYKKIPDYSDMRHLKASKQKIISNKMCQNYTGFQMSSVYWCTASVNGYHYHGDSGNGLVTSNSFLVGVASYLINDVTIYSDVMRQHSWMQSAHRSMAVEYCNG